MRESAGQTAHSVGAAAGDLARHAQVLCVTHLPQIAGLADHHLHVEKAVSGGRTTVAVCESPAEERVHGTGADARRRRG